MAYPNFYNPYQSYYQPPMPDQLTQLRQGQYQQQMTAPAVQQPANNGINWVQGEEGAKAYLVAAGNSVLLMDSEATSFYIKSTDPSGMPLPLRIFDYTERTAAPKTPVQAAQEPGVEYVTRSEFDALEAKIDGILAVSAADKKPAKKKEETDDG
uniref:Uncharacterized protein n=1 Tax=Dulem virus 33 TaxID=3145751 RepID=A0AAU8B5M0_9CAUD